jgi:hypothetical protein
MVKAQDSLGLAEEGFCHRLELTDSAGGGFCGPFAQEGPGSLSERFIRGALGRPRGRFIANAHSRRGGPSSARSSVAPTPRQNGQVRNQSAVPTGPNGASEGERQSSSG